MKKLLAFCFALALVTSVVAPGVSWAQDTMQNNSMKSDSPKPAIDVKGKISDDGKTFVSDKDGKSWTIINPEAVKGHEDTTSSSTPTFIPTRCKCTSCR